MPLVRMPWGIGLCTLKVDSMIECPRGIDVELEIGCCHTVQVDDVGISIPHVEEARPPCYVGSSLHVKSDAVVEALNGCAERDELLQEEVTSRDCPGGK